MSAVAKAKLPTNTELNWREIHEALTTDWAGGYAYNEGDDSRTVVKKKFGRSTPTDFSKN